MKKITLFMVAATLLAGCSKEDTTSSTFENFIIGVPGQVDDGTVGNEENLYEDDLIAGQNLDAGTVTVSVVDGNIVVTYTSDGDWQIDETHLYIGDLEDLPTTPSGNPKIGHFPYSGSHGGGTTTVSYVGPELAEGDCVYIAAHAVVTNTASGQAETAWAAGLPMGGNSWAMGFEVCL